MPPHGILIANTGSPAAPTAQAVRPYLAEFLSDPRVIQLPRWLWMPILHGILLRIRSPRSARMYRHIWTPTGSPLLRTAERQAAGLQARIGAQARVVIGMRYGQPSIASGLQALEDEGTRRILVFPLFPQYSSATSESVFDAAATALQGRPDAPEIWKVRSYPAHPGYLQALASSVRMYWAQHGRPDRLLISFHGLPQSYIRRGDPYLDECRQTAGLLAERLELPPKTWAMSFQSRFGPVRWLQPYTDELLARWGAAGTGTVHVLCPGFSADCLETLDEIQREARHTYLEAGGRDFHYIPALNDRANHLDALAEIALQAMDVWPGGRTTSQALGHSPNPASEAGSTLPKFS